MGGVAAVMGAGWAAAGVVALETNEAQARSAKENEAEMRMMEPFMDGGFGRKFKTRFQGQRIL
jgi:hypothetical protein